MKMLAVLGALLMSSAAFAEISTLPPTQVEKPLQVLIQGERTDLTGVLILDHAAKQITVNLYQDICGSLQPVEPGTVRCMAAASLKHSYKVPFKRLKDGCGSKYYAGSVDDRRVDGPKIDIMVEDHANRLCKDMVRSSLIVTVKIETLFGGTPGMIELLR